MEGKRMWAQTHGAVMQALQADEIVHLPNLQGLESLWETFDDTKQDDASHFLQELVALADTRRVIQGYHQVDFRQEVHAYRAFPFHLIFHEDQGTNELEQLIAAWANVAGGQVCDGIGLWVAQIGRYRQVDGQWTKHHRALQVPSIFNLPLTLDGQETRTQQFSLIGFLCHSGTAHQEGHFYAVFVYRGLYWLVDDGAYPKVTQTISDKIKQQIVQVWAIPSNRLLPAHVESDVADTPRASSDEPKAKRGCAESIGFDFANVTQLGQTVRQWVITRPRRPLFMAETHLGPQDHEKMVQWFTTRGLGVLGEPAAESSKGGTYGGLMLVFPWHLHFHFIEKQIVDGCGWYAVTWTFANSELVLIMTYFKCGEGLQGPTNARLWGGLTAFVKQVKKPLMIFGDFNITPEVFMTTTLAQTMQVQILATGEETCNTGNELDWGLVSTPLIADVRMQADWMVPFKPHAMLRISIAGHFEDVTVRQLSKYGPAPQMQKVEREWHQIEAKNVEVKWLNKEADDLTNRVGSIYDRIERYVLQNLDKPSLGRGTSLQYVQRPLHDPSKPWKQIVNLGIKGLCRSLDGTLMQTGTTRPRFRALATSCCSKCCGINMVTSTFMFC